MNRWHRAREVIVHDDAPALPQIDAKLFEPQSFNVGLAPDREHREVGLENFSVAQPSFECGADLSKLLHLRFQNDPHPFGLELVVKVASEVAVEAA